MAARRLSLALGAWLVVSAVLWSDGAQRLNGVLVGVLLLLFASRSARLRPGAALLGVWLFLSAFALPKGSLFGVWNHALVGLGVFLAALAAMPLSLPLDLGPRRT